MKVNKRLMAKISALEKNDSESKAVMRINAFPKGIEMEKTKVVVSEKESLKKDLFEIKNMYEARVKKLNKEILRKESIINRLHDEKNVASKKIKEVKL